MGVILFNIKMLIPLKNRTLGVQMMEIDEEDWDKIKNLNLCINHTSNPHTLYAKSVIYEKCKYIKTLNIHRVIMGLDDYKKDKRIINHIDGNGLNNKKENLEICSGMFNSQSIRCKNKNVGHICYDTSMKRKKRWRFDITINKKRHRKRFNTEEEAEEYKKNIYDSLKVDADLLIKK